MGFWVLTVVEKVILLQNVEVFADATTEQLSLVAAIALERRVEDGAVVYGESDPSDAMYVVVDGSVRLHQADDEVTVAKSRDAFGVWALFDEELRVTAATACEPSLLLCIRRDDFVDVLADHVELTQAILGSIARRLRTVLSRVGGLR